MKFIIKMIESLAHARQLQAAFTVAKQLKDTNKDFQHVALGDIVQRIMDEQHPTHIDGSPVEKS